MRLLPFLLLALGFRFLSFFPSVLDHDESTYLVIADQILEGDIYWKDIFDTKPPGIFLVFALLLKIAGHSLPGVRLLVALWIGLSAWGLAAILRKWIPRGPGPWLGGVTYILLTSLYKPFGVAPNTELFFAGFSIAALWFLVVHPWRPGAMLAAGILLGCGIAIKPMAAFDALAFGLFFLTAAVRQRENRFPRVLSLAGMTLACLVPTAILFAWYAEKGLADTWYFHSFVLPGRYPETWRLWPAIRYVGDFFLRFLPFTVLGVLALRPFNDGVRLAGIWMMCATVSILLPGNDFPHYTIQWMPPLALLAGLALRDGTFLQRRVGEVKIRTWGLTALGLLLAVCLHLQYKDYVVKPDPKREAYDLIRQSVPTDASGHLSDNPHLIYTGDVDYQILYFLLDADPPVDYPHRSLLWEEEHRANFGLDLRQELEPVFLQPPLFWLMSKEHEFAPVRQLLWDRYTPLDTFDNRIVLYQRRI